MNQYISLYPTSCKLHQYFHSNSKYLSQNKCMLHTFNWLWKTQLNVKHHSHATYLNLYYTVKKIWVLQMCRSCSSIKEESDVDLQQDYKFIKESNRAQYGPHRALIWTSMRQTENVWRHTGQRNSLNPYSNKFSKMLRKIHLQSSLKIPELVTWGRSV